MKQKFRPAGLTPAQTLRLYVTLKLRQRAENTLLNLIVAMAFMWIVVIARCAYMLTRP